MSGAVEIAVIGAGPAGSATALQLARAGHQVLLLERGQFDGARPGESLAPQVQDLVHALGLARELQALAPLPSFGLLSAWADPEPQAHSHLGTPHGTGLSLDRRAFDRMLAEAAARAGAELALGAHVLGCAPHAGGYQLQLERAGRRSQLQCRALVDAGGRSSPLGRWLGARRVLFDRLLGVGAELAHAPGARRDCILVEAQAEGWWYSAPLHAERTVAMLMLDGDDARLPELRTQRGFEAALRETRLTRERLAGAQLTAAPRVHLACSQRLVREEQALRAPWIAVGDAALAVDPLSGSGVARALRGAHDAARALSTFLNGDVAAIAQHELSLHAECTRYLYERAAQYGQVTRFPGAAFWERRRAH